MRILEWDDKALRLKGSVEVDGKKQAARIVARFAGILTDADFQEVYRQFMKDEAYSVDCTGFRLA